MTKDEALRLALEVLKRASDAGYSIECEEAITAIKAALEAKDEPWEKFCDSHCVWTDHHPDCKLAQRTWVGLDVEDYIKALELCDFDKDAAFEFFEAKLKELNT